jgi:deazaflavin-dependent oxidoreductase (nitroreductase family)
MPQSEFDLRTTNLRIIEEYRATGGEGAELVAGRFKGDGMLLLTTTGRKSGEARTTPVGYRMDGDRMYILTMNAGRPQLPNWYWNLGANPQVTLEVGTETYQARAVVAGEVEGERLLAQFAGREPRLQAALDKMTADAAPRPRRRVPIVRLERL